MNNSMKVAWVWYSFLFWISPTFLNHLKFRWYHYKFCKGRAEIFRIQLYLGEWKLEIERIITKNPKAIIPSFGYVSILKMLSEQKAQKLINFLESDNFQEGVSIFITELNEFINTDPNDLETLQNPNQNDVKDKETITPITPPSLEMIQLEFSDNLTTNEDSETEYLKNNSSRSDQINARTFAIATQIYYELHRSKGEHYQIKATNQLFASKIKGLFRINDLPENISKFKNFDYTEFLEEKNAFVKGQLRRQLEQIVNNPVIFQEDISKYAKELIDKYFNI